MPCIKKVKPKSGPELKKVKPKFGPEIKKLNQNLALN
jgi:hypothetical protein